MQRIMVAQPKMAGNERKYVLDCLDTNWISSNGKYIPAFEEAFAKFCGVKHGASQASCRLGHAANGSISVERVYVLTMQSR
ncbi:DegT/DnrJ/EryC1/StrS family aminotransferase, partial [Burkholderia vietnamiensis]|uniref:DegT/DnrJ/EryC1/StrS family aminotransferase n=1 Tax=Burkholderia vietnamiensis TaxID=60552 RepID=UPI001592AF8B